MSTGGLIIRRSEVGFELEGVSHPYVNKKKAPARHENTKKDKKWAPLPSLFFSPFVGPGKVPGVPLLAPQPLPRRKEENGVRYLQSKELELQPSELLKCTRRLGHCIAREVGGGQIKRRGLLCSLNLRKHRHQMRKGTERFTFKWSAHHYKRDRSRSI